MNRRQAIGALGLAAAPSLAAADSDRERFPGIYRVVNWKTTNPDGTEVEPRRYEFTSKGLNLSVPTNFNTRLEWERVGDA